MTILALDCRILFLLRWHWLKLWHLTFYTYGLRCGAPGRPACRSRPGTPSRSRGSGAIYGIALMYQIIYCIVCNIHKVLLCMYRYNELTDICIYIYIYVEGEREFVKRNLRISKGHIGCLKRSLGLKWDLLDR